MRPPWVLVGNMGAAWIKRDRNTATLLCKGWTPPLGTLLLLFLFWVPLIKIEHQQKGTLIIEGLLGISS